MKPGVAWKWQVGATYMIKVQEIDNTNPIFLSNGTTRYSIEFKTSF